MRQIFLLLVLVPHLIFASFSPKDHRKVVEKISAEWQRHYQLVEQFNRLGMSDRAQHIAFLQESIECCQRGIDYCDYVLKKIAKKAKEERGSWVQAKQACEEYKNSFHREIGSLREIINRTVDVAKATDLYQKSGEKVSLASLKSQNAPPRRLDNVEEVVTILNEIGMLYEEAALLAREALNLIANFSDEKDKDFLKQAIANYEAAASHHKKEAADWLSSAYVQKAEVEELLAVLKEDGKLFKAMDLKSRLYETQKQMAPLLEQLGGECQEELAQVKAAIADFEKEEGEKDLSQ